MGGKRKKFKHQIKDIDKIALAEALKASPHTMTELARALGFKDRVVLWRKLKGYIPISEREVATLIEYIKLDKRKAEEIIFGGRATPL